VENVDREVEEKLEKLKDVEVSAKRIFTGKSAYVIGAIGLFMSVFHIYILFFRATDPWIFQEPPCRLRRCNCCS